MAQNQNITENDTQDNTKTKTCLWFNRYSDCTGIGTKEVPGYEDLWLCQTCYDKMEQDEQRTDDRVSQSTMVNQIETGE